MKTLLYPRVKTATFWLKNGKLLKMYPGLKTKRLYARINKDDWVKVYFKVLYGKAKTGKGKLTMFYNEAFHDNPKDARQGLLAFMEGV